MSVQKTVISVEVLHHPSLFLTYFPKYFLPPVPVETQTSLRYQALIMPSYPNYSGLSTYLHHYIRFMIYDFVVRDQKLQILSLNRSDLNSPFKTWKNNRIRD